jgi:hypothetical protein
MFISTLLPKPSWLRFNRLSMKLKMETRKDRYSQLEPLTPRPQSSWLDPMLEPAKLDNLRGLE